MSHLHDLMVLNNRLLRILQHSKPKTNSSEFYLLYGTLPVNKLVKFQMLIHAHNIFYCSERLPKIFLADRLMNSDVHSHKTRSSHDFHRFASNSGPGSRTSLNICIKLWNDLPQQLKNIPGVVTFEKQIKKLLSLENI